MLPKLRLDQAAEYEQTIAAYEISKMICAFVEGRKHIFCIGAEQGNIVGWDDFVIQNCQSEFTYLQIKRQQTDFSPDGDCIRNANQRLTPLDNSISSLGSWIATYDSTVNPNIYNFRLCLPHDGPEIKRSLELRNLRDFMTLHINSTTTIQGLENLQNVANDGNAKKIYNWLTTWCGFTDWEHIRKALQKLKIIDYRTEPDIDSESIDELSRVFSEPAKVLLLLKSYTQENSAYTGNISPRQLLFLLKDYLLDSQRTWTQIENIGTSWQFSGILDLESNEEIERPSKTIPQLWSNEKGRELNINISPVSFSLGPIHESIFQLAIHLDGNVSGLCMNWDGWKICIENKLGGTLGFQENDFEGLRISNNGTPFKMSGGKMISTNSDLDVFAQEMTVQMIKTTWELVSQKLNWRISRMVTVQSAELRDAMEARWVNWKAALDRDESALTKLFKKIVHPNAEGEDILGNLRIGPKTKLLIADALFTCLLVSVALDVNNSGLMQTEDGLSIGAIGLSWWSGPAGKLRRVQRIDEEESVKFLIGKESYDILVLSQSELSESEVYKLPLSESVNIDNSIAGGRTPKLLVTCNRLFNSIVNRGSINELGEYLQQKLNSQKESLTETLNNNAS